jgi:hypothetical protein
LDGTQQAVEVRQSAQKRGFSLWRVVRVGCLLVIVGFCASVGAIAAALQSGPLQITIPGESLLKLGSDDFVMSNYSFQNGTTYYLDFDGNGVRNIVQLHYMADSRKLEVVLHHATKDVMRDRNLFTMPIP